MKQNLSLLWFLLQKTNFYIDISLLSFIVITNHSQSLLVSVGGDQKILLNDYWSVITNIIYYFIKRLCMLHVPYFKVHEHVWSWLMWSQFCTVNPSLHTSLQFRAAKSSLHKKQIQYGRFQRARLTKSGDMISDWQQILYLLFLWDQLLTIHFSKVISTIEPHFCILVMYIRWLYHYFSITRKPGLKYENDVE